MKNTNIIDLIRKKYFVLAKKILLRTSLIYKNGVFFILAKNFLQRTLAY